MDRGRARAQRMILGIGSDLIDVRRIERAIERHGERFLDRIFTADRARAGRAARQTASRPTPSASPPRRPAPRRSAPACAAGVFWRDMGVVNLPSGRPTMKLTGGALARLQAITPAGCEARIDLTITDEGPMAQASWSSRRRRAGVTESATAVDPALRGLESAGSIPQGRVGTAARRLLLAAAVSRGAPTLFSVRGLSRSEGSTH